MKFWNQQGRGEYERAMGLLHARYDGEPVSKEDEVWLAEFLARCDEAARHARGLEQLKEELSAWSVEAAPIGFAARVEAQLSQPGHRWGQAWRSWQTRSVGALAGVAALGLALMIWPQPSKGPGPVSVGGTTGVVSSRPHFIIRPSGAGAARLRAVAEQVALAGSDVELAAGHIELRIERAELISVLGQLESLGGVELSLARDLVSEDATVLLRFEFE